MGGRRDHPHALRPGYARFGAVHVARRRERVIAGAQHLPPHPVGHHGHLRDPRQRADGPRPQRARRAARHVRGARSPGGDRLPDVPGGDRRRAPAHSREDVRALPGGQGPAELLGVQHPVVLRAGAELCDARGAGSRPARRGRRGEGHGSVPARGGAGGHPRRRVQPHVRGGHRRPHGLLARTRPDDLLHDVSGEPGGPHGHHGLRELARLQALPRHPDDPRLAASTGSARSASTDSGSTWPSRSAATASTSTPATPSTWPWSPTRC